MPIKEQTFKEDVEELKTVLDEYDSEDEDINNLDIQNIPEKKPLILAQPPTKPTIIQTPKIEDVNSALDEFDAEEVGLALDEFDSEDTNQNEEAPQNRRESVKSFVRKNEAANNYNSYNRGEAGDADVTIDLVNMPIKEIQRRQKLPKGHPDRLFATGAYQVITATLDEAVEGLGIDTEETFSVENQEKIADWIIDVKRPHLGKIINQTEIDTPQNLKNAREDLAKEWAVVPKDGGGSFYEGIAGNKSKKLSIDEVNQIILGNYKDWKVTEVKPPVEEAVDYSGFLTEEEEEEEKESNAFVDVSKVLTNAFIETGANIFSSGFLAVRRIGTVLTKGDIKHTVESIDILKEIVKKETDPKKIERINLVIKDNEKKIETLTAEIGIQKTFDDNIDDYKRIIKSLKSEKSKNREAEAAEYLSGGGDLKQIWKNIKESPLKYGGDLFITALGQAPQWVGSAYSKSFAVVNEVSRMSNTLSDIEKENGVKLDDDLRTYAELSYGLPFGALNHIISKMSIIPGASGITKIAQNIQGGLIKKAVALGIAKLGVGLFEGAEEIIQDKGFEGVGLVLLSIQKERLLKSGNIEEADKLDKTLLKMVNTLYSKKEAIKSGVLGFLLGTGATTVVEVKGDITSLIERDESKQQRKIEELKKEKESIKKEIGPIGKKFIKVHQQTVEVENATTQQQRLINKEKIIDKKIEREEVKLKTTVDARQKEIDKNVIKVDKTKQTEQVEVPIKKDGEKKEGTEAGIAGLNKFAEETENTRNFGKDFELTTGAIEVTGKSPVIPFGHQASGNVFEVKGKRYINIEPTEETLKIKDPKLLRSKLEAEKRKFKNELGSINVDKALNPNQSRIIKEINDIDYKLSELNKDEKEAEVTESETADSEVEIQNLEKKALKLKIQFSKYGNKKENQDKKTELEKKIKEVTNQIRLKKFKETITDNNGELVKDKLPLRFHDSYNFKGEKKKRQKFAKENPKIEIYKEQTKDGIVTIVELAGSKKEQQRLIPNIKNIKNIKGKIIIGKKPKSISNVVFGTRIAFSRTGENIYVNKEELDKGYDTKVWTRPKVEGVIALKENSFKTKAEFYKFVLHHENAHQDFPFISGKSTEGEYENVINQITLMRMGKGKLANKTYGKMRKAEEMDDFAKQWTNLHEYNVLRGKSKGEVKEDVKKRKEEKSKKAKPPTTKRKRGPPTDTKAEGEQDADQEDDPRIGEELPAYTDEDDPTNPTNIKPDTTPKIKPDTTPKIKPDTTPKIKPDTTPKIKPDTTPKIKPDTTPKIKPDTTPKIKLDKPTISDGVLAYLEAQSEKAKDRINKRGTRLLSGLPLDEMADYTIIGASYIAKGLHDFTEWSTKMVKDFGEAIEPYLNNIWDTATNKIKELQEIKEEGDISNRKKHIVSIKEYEKQGINVLDLKLNKIFTIHKKMGWIISVNEKDQEKLDIKFNKKTGEKYADTLKEEKGKKGKTKTEDFTKKGFTPEQLTAISLINKGVDEKIDEEKEKKSVDNLLVTKKGLIENYKVEIKKAKKLLKTLTNESDITRIEKEINIYETDIKILLNTPKLTVAKKTGWLVRKGKKPGTLPSKSETVILKSVIKKADKDKIKKERYGYFLLRKKNKEQIFNIPENATENEKKIIEKRKIIFAIFEILYNQVKIQKKTLTYKQKSTGFSAILKLSNQIEKLQYSNIAEEFEESKGIEPNLEIDIGSIKKLTSEYDEEGKEASDIVLDKIKYVKANIIKSETIPNISRKAIKEIEELDKEISRSNPNKIKKNSILEVGHLLKERDELVHFNIEFIDYINERLDNVERQLETKDASNSNTKLLETEHAQLLKTKTKTIEKNRSDIKNLNLIIKRKYIGLYDNVTITEKQNTDLITLIERNNELKTLIEKNENNILETSDGVLSDEILRSFHNEISRNNNEIRKINKTNQSNIDIIDNAIESDFSFTNEDETINTEPTETEPEKPINKKIRILTKPLEWIGNLSETIYNDVKFLVKSKNKIYQMIGKEWTLLIGKYNRVSKEAQFFTEGLVRKTNESERALMPLLIQARSILRSSGMKKFRDVLYNDINNTKTVVGENIEALEKELALNSKANTKKEKQEVENSKSNINATKNTLNFLTNAQNTLKNISDKRMNELLEMSEDIDKFNEGLFKANKNAFHEMDVNQQIDYVAQIWGNSNFTNNKESIDINNFKKFLKDNRFLENKYYDNYLDGIKSGKNPRFFDIAKIIDMNTQVGLQAISNKMIVDMLKGKNRGGYQLITKDIEQGKNLGYVSIESLGIKVDDIKDMYIHPDAVPAIKAIFLDRLRNKYWKFIETLNGFAKKANLSYTLFHHLTLVETDIGTTGFKGYIKKFKKRSGQKAFGLIEDYEDIKNVLKNGSYELLLKNWADAGDFVEYGGTLGAVADVYLDEVTKALNKAEELSKATKIPGLDLIPKGLKIVNEKMDRFLWNYLHDSLKIEGYKILIDQNMVIAEKRYGSLNPEIIENIKIETAKQVNDTYGGQNWKAMMVNPADLQIAQLALLSPDWTFSTITQFFSIFGNFTQLRTSDSAWIRSQMGRRFWINSLVIYGGGLQILNGMVRANDDEEEWRKRIEQIQKEINESYGVGRNRNIVRLNNAIKNKPNVDLLDINTLIHLSTFGNASGNKFSVFFGRDKEGKEVYRSTGKQFKEVFEYAFDLSSPEAVDYLPDFGFSNIYEPLKRLSGKVSPIIRAASIIVTGNTPSGLMTGWNSETVKLRSQGKTAEATISMISEVVQQAFPFSAGNIFGEGDFSPLDLVIGKKGISKTQIRRSIRDSYEDLLDNKIEHNGVATKGAIIKWNKRMAKVSESAISNGFDPAPLFKDVIHNTIKGVKEGNKGRVWNRMGDLEQAIADDKAEKDLIKKTAETIRAKRYVDNLTVLYTKIENDEIRQFRNASKNRKFLIKE